MSTDGVSLMVASPLEESLLPVASTIPCFHCERILGISEASRAVWRSAPAPHRAVCASCFLMQYDTSMARMPLSPGQAQELADYFRQKGLHDDDTPTTH